MEKEMLKQIEERKAMLLGEKDVARDGIFKTFPLYQFESAFASGQVYSSTLCDSLICQEYFRPFVMSLVNLLTFHDVVGVSHVFLIPIPRSYEVRNQSLVEFLEVFVLCYGFLGF